MMAAIYGDSSTFLARRCVSLFEMIAAPDKIFFVAVLEISPPEPT